MGRIDPLMVILGGFGIAGLGFLFSLPGLLVLGPLHLCVRTSAWFPPIRAHDIACLLMLLAFTSIAIWCPFPPGDRQDALMYVSGVCILSSGWWLVVVRALWIADVEGVYRRIPIETLGVFFAFLGPVYLVFSVNDVMMVMWWVRPAQPDEALAELKKDAVLALGYIGCIALSRWTLRNSPEAPPTANNEPAAASGSAGSP